MNKYLHLVLCAIILLFGIHVNAQCWTLVWGDEFNSTTLNNNKWEAANDSAPYNNEQQAYTGRAINVSQSGGKLNLTGRYESYQGKHYTSGKITSRDKFFFTNGKIEARMKLPIGKGCWPAFWMLAQSDYYGNYPATGEIDIMELISQSPSTSYSTIHNIDAYTGNLASSSADTTLVQGNFSSAYHIFGCEWDTNELRFFLDGKLFASKNKNQHPNFNWPFDQPFYIILNLAIGGNWPEPPDSAAYPQSMLVDWVRVYQRTTDYRISGNLWVQPSTAYFYSLPSMANTTYQWSVNGGAILTDATKSKVKIRWNAIRGNKSCSCITTTGCGAATVNMQVFSDYNLLSNPGFENNLHFWKIGNYGSQFTQQISSTAFEGNKCFAMEVSSIGPNSWDAQLLRTDIPLTQSNQYRVDFFARTDVTPKLFYCSVISPYTYSPYGNIAVNLTDAWTKYSYTFTATETVAALLTFDFGAQMGTIFLDTISIVNKSKFPNAREPASQEYSHFRKPAISYLYNKLMIADLENQSTIEIFGMNGKRLQAIEVANKFDDVIPTQNLPNGMYTVRVTTNNTCWAQKIFVIN